MVCAGRRPEPLAETVALIEKAGGDGLAVSADITDKKQVEELVQKATAAYGNIDLLFNNAGSFQALGPIWETEPEAWWKDVTINLYGTALCCHAVLPEMIKQNSGIVINMAPPPSCQERL